MEARGEQGIWNKEQTRRSLQLEEEEEEEEEGNERQQRVLQDDEVVERGEGVFSATPTPSSSLSLAALPPKAWRWPWIVTLFCLYLFILPWMIQVIVIDYWIKRNWNVNLIRLDTTIYHKFFMLWHMTFGGIAVLLGPTQFLPGLRRTWPVVHRWCGRIYCVCAMGASIFGVIFIGLKRGVLVGGYNMAWAFGCAGVVLAVCTYRVYQTARAGLFVEHRNWTLRSYGQILAPPLYQWFYGVMINVFHWETWTDNDVQTGICTQYTWTLDQIHCWTYWLIPLLVTEGIVRSFPAIEKDTDLLSTPQATNDRGMLQQNNNNDDGENDCTHAAADVDFHRGEDAPLLLPSSVTRVVTEETEGLHPEVAALVLSLKEEQQNESNGQNTHIIKRDIPSANGSQASGQADNDEEHQRGENASADATTNSAHSSINSHETDANPWLALNLWGVGLAVVTSVLTTLYFTVGE